jgi:hypothetical protein
LSIIRPGRAPKGKNMNAHIVTPPSDLMTPIEQDLLLHQVNDDLEAFMKASGKSPIAVLYFLVSFTWGWARRCRWSTNQLAEYSIKAWETNRRAHNEKKVQ